MKKIELKDLRAVPPYKVFATGETSLVRWLAHKLPNHYWTIYTGGHFTPDYGVVAKGIAMPITKAKLLISCDSEVWKRYKEGGEK